VVPTQSHHPLQCIVIRCIVSCLFHHIAVLGKFSHSCNIALLGRLTFLGKVTILGKVAILASLLSWQPCCCGDFAVLGKFPCPLWCCLVIVLFCGKVAFPDNLDSLGKGGNRNAFCAGVALFVALAPAQSRCRLQCIVILCVIILVVVLSMLLPCTRHHHSHGIVVLIAIGRRGCANRFASLGPGNTQPLGVALSPYPASSSPYMALSSSSTSAGTYMPTSLLPWPGVLDQALSKMKTMPVAFCLPPLSCTWRVSVSSVVDARPCVALPYVIRATDVPSLSFLAAHCLQWLSVHGIVVAHCTRPRGTDAIVVLSALN
jgi:hypothetical protein